jgi:hypothetical protein
MIHPRLHALPLLSLLAASFLFLGCERDKADVSETKTYMDDNTMTLDDKPGSVNLTPRAALSLSPGSATIAAIGDTIVFTAAGGSPPYEWAMGNDNGVLDIRGGNPCVYRVTKLKQNSVYVKDQRKSVVVATLSVTTF